MKSSRLILATSLFVATTTLAFAGPGPQYWQDRLAERRRAATTAPAERAKPAMDCPHCKTTIVETPVGPGKVVHRTRKTECTGCAKMAAGGKC